MMLEQILISGIRELGIDVSPEARQKLLDYLGLLGKWNRVYNLTAIRNPEQMISHHVLDSLAVLPHLWPKNWLDVGCGAGLPGIVLAIVRPEWTFTLLDSNSKKISFVQQVLIELQLNNVQVCSGRVEDCQFGQKFDGIISRAFAETTEFVELTQHLLIKSGRWAAMKGTPDSELLRLPEHIKVEKVIPLKVPKLDAARCLVILRENK
ncbi:MAG: 16S rRNA (guanine(527)-N(7))-methyltransferase RsmG [Gallionellaceae bacterium]|jgi:16S rRNA (guanine527-N7)-methyltransferase